MIATAFRWFLGLNTLLVFVAGLFEGWPAAAVGALALSSAILLPPTGARLSQYVTPIGRPWVAVTAGLVVCIVGMVLLAVQTKSQSTVASSSPKQNPAAAAPAQSAAPAPSKQTSPKQAQAPEAKKPEVVDIRSKIDPAAAAPIQGPSWTKTIQEWGDDWIRRINIALPKVAERIARSPDCDYVEIIGVSSRSTPRQNVIFYVDCRNLQRFYVSETELGSATAPVSKNAKTAGISDAVAITACVNQVKDQLKLPLSFDRHVLSSKIYRSPYGHISIEFDFSAKNQLGGVIPQHARCVIDDTGISPAEISAR